MGCYVERNVADFEDADVVTFFVEADAGVGFGTDGHVVTVPRHFGRGIAAHVALEADRFARFGHFVMRHRVEFGRGFPHPTAASADFTASVGRRF